MTVATFNIYNDLFLKCQFRLIDGSKTIPVVCAFSSSFALLICCSVAFFFFFKFLSFSFSANLLHIWPPSQGSSMLSIRPSKSLDEGDEELSEDDDKDRGTEKYDSRKMTKKSSDTYM